MEAPNVALCVSLQFFLSLSVSLSLLFLLLFVSHSFSLIACSVQQLLSVGADDAHTDASGLTPFQYLDRLSTSSNTDTDPAATASAASEQDVHCHFSTALPFCLPFSLVLSFTRFAINQSGVCLSCEVTLYSRRDMYAGAQSRRGACGPRGRLSESRRSPALEADGPPRTR